MNFFKLGSARTSRVRLAAMRQTFDGVRGLSKQLSISLKSARTPARPVGAEKKAFPRRCPTVAGIGERIGYERPWRNWLLTKAVAARPGRIGMRKLSGREVA